MAKAGKREKFGKASKEVLQMQPQIVRLEQQRQEKQITEPPRPSVVGWRIEYGDVGGYSDPLARLDI